MFEPSVGVAVFIVTEKKFLNTLFPCNIDDCVSDCELTFLPLDDNGADISEDHTGNDSVDREPDLWESDTMREPCVGMVFMSEGRARSFYNSYARRVGFGTRVRYSHRSDHDNQLVVQRYVCSKEGFRQNMEGARKRDRAITRVGCNASMTVRKVSPDTWVVKSFEREHNHPLVSPMQVQFLRSHKVKLSVLKNLPTNSGTPNNVSDNTTFMMMNEQDSGVRDFDFIEGKFDGCLPTVRQKSLRGGDTPIILEYLKHMQSENPSFFYAVQVDMEDHLTNFFWVDAASRMAYKSFGDVITFDTSYLTNKYRLPFAPIVGVNHHNQSVLFGCALLADNTKLSYFWLFKTWLKAMGGKHPVSIITDHNHSIQAAVTEVFPNTRHRFCMWHIQRKMLEKLGHVVRTQKKFKDEFQKCIHQARTIEDFESSWHMLLNTFDLNNNDWLQLLYQDRQYWVPLYLKGTFFAEMSTTQRSYAFFEGFYNVNTGPEEFLKRYNNALDSRYSKEVRAEFDTIYTTPNLKTSSPLEKTAADLYTREIFKKFQVELFECFGYIANKVSEGPDANGTYVVAKFGEEDRSYTVIFNELAMTGSCSCQKFECAGIICRHLLSVFKVTNIFHLPDHFILKRWTRGAKRREMLNEETGDAKGSSPQSMMARYNDLCHRSVIFAEEGSKSLESYSVAVRALQGALEEVSLNNDSVSGLAKAGSRVN